jgi:hypothetical protein
VEAILANPALYAVAQAIPRARKENGGRSRHYPDYMLLLYEALVSVYLSARQVEAELAHPVLWRIIRKAMKSRFPDHPEMHLPRRPMRRHHYLYGRNRYLASPDVLAGIARLHREISAEQAREIGLLREDGPGSWTHPHLSRMLHADGKVITPLFRGRAGQTAVNKETGEIRQVRYEPDADLHFEGDGETAYGTKFVLVAARGAERRSRIILDVEWVEKKGGEAATAMGCFGRVAPLVPGAQGVIYDTALRGVHHQVLLRELGMLPVNRVSAAVKGAKDPRRHEGRRVEKSIHLENKMVTTSAGESSVSLFARGGAVGTVELSDKGEPIFTELRRVRTHRSRDKSGLFRWYNDYELPESYGRRTITVRLHGNADDAKRKLNRTENVRPIPPTDPDFRALYARRNDAESINRGLNDSMWLTRAHSIGHRRQHVNLIGYALMVNSLALQGHRAREGTRSLVA